MKFWKLVFSFFIIASTILGTFLPFEVNAIASVDILVSVSPENPAPDEKVNISLKSYVNNLDIILISWSVNNETMSSGIGKKSFSLNAPKAGKETNVIATISLPDGTTDTKIIIKPTVMVLLSEAMDSYVPPFYRGKALPSPDSLVRIVALPEVKSGSNYINPKNMTYVWKKDYTNNQDGSGYGKNVFTYVNDYLENSNNIEVTASTTDQKNLSTKSINIGTKEPKIIFYKNDVKLGTIWEQALNDGHTILGDEVIEAAPYFISPSDIRIPMLNWNWFINDQTVNAPIYRKNTLPLKAQAGTSGTSKIRLEINNTEKIFESAIKEINVNF
ncbi:MAG: hypothetical protein WC694_02590 [Candidatus Paceibacterota bacterium]|jgi:hypothetical protein